MTHAALSGTEVLGRAQKLQRFWNKRDLKFKDWYEQIKMVDTLAQKEMESFVGNDPRASFNLVSNLLDQKIPHRILPGKLNLEEVIPAANLSSMYDTIWENIYDDYRLRGRLFLKDVIDYLLATGWYSVFAVPSRDGSEFVSEVWNPITVYPSWSNVLSQCAHIFTPGKESVEYLVFRNNWKLRSDPVNNTTIYDYWWVEYLATGMVIHNSIMVGQDQVKPDTIEPRFKRIPIFIAPVGGLPDTGELAKGRKAEEWKQDIGQSFIVTNENVYKAVNKWWTYMMQIVRDTAQARTFEKSTSATRIVQPETWYRRGAHYKLGPQDEIGFISPPSIPVEIRSIQLDLEAMEQRGGPSWTMFGSVQQRMTAYAMSQVAATTNTIAKAYHTGVINLFTDIDNFFFDLIKTHSYKPYGVALPKGLPANAKLTAEYELRIPGDLIQRATTARMLNSSFELSDERIMEELFPEIKNPSEELGKVRASKARKNPIYAQLSLIEALRIDAEQFRRAGDSESAELFDKAVSRLEQMILASGETQRPGEERRAIERPRPEVLPPGESAKIPKEGQQ